MGHVKKAVLDQARKLPDDCTLGLAQLAADAAESLQSYPDRGYRLADPHLSRYRELILGVDRRASAVSTTVRRASTTVRL